MIQEYLSQMGIEGIYSGIMLLYMIFFGAVLFKVFSRKEKMTQTYMADLPLAEEKRL
ncbi:MAG: hypothetical protein ACD_73C00211G0002 [uncultured bacterium]|nr:MAG: hypothetical protein ACD_73C00211G0002 [uncultured bacterium]